LASAVRASVRYFPADASGFEVVLSRGDDEFTASFAGWHEPFDSPEVARRERYSSAQVCHKSVIKKAVGMTHTMEKGAEPTGLDPL